MNLNHFGSVDLNVNVLFHNRGTDELLGVMDRVALVNSTLGKAVGGAAGRFYYVAAFWSLTTAL